MHHTLTAGRTTALAWAAVGLAMVTPLLGAGTDEAATETEAVNATVNDTATSPALPEIAARSARAIGRHALAWSRRTPPADRITWGGLAACAGLGLWVVLERLVRLRRRRVVPRDFVSRYLDRLQEGKLDRGKALDFCELNPSPASRVALAAVRRWGRPVADLERAVAMAHRVEADQLRRNVGTLRRVAALAPLLGLLGSLFAAGRVLAGMGNAVETAWGPALAHALTPLTVGVALAILALVAYDGLTGRVETLTGILDRLGSETVDAIAMTSLADPRAGELRAHFGSPPRSPHAIRVEIPDPLARPRDRDEKD